MLVGLLTPVLWAQAQDLANRPVADIRIEGLKQVTSKLVLNQVRLLKGGPYDAKLVQEDVVRITHLGRFSSVTARVEPRADGSLVVTFVVQELPLLADVLVVGNKALADQELLTLAGLKTGDPIDPFLIERGVRQMQAAYEKQGYFQAQITPDQELLKDANVLIFRVREGASSQIRAIRFENNTIYTDKQLRSKIKSEEAWNLLFVIPFKKGEVNREQLEQDAARLRDFYRDNGYLDAQVGRRIEVSPDQKDAVVVFIINEGRQFTVASIRIEGNQLFSADQILQAMYLKAGDVFASDRLRKTQESLVDLYGKLGFIETRINIERLFHEKEPKVDLLIKIDEGHAYTVGTVMISGNQTTQDKVAQRQVRGMLPGRRFDRSGIATTETRLKESPFFGDAKVAILGDPQDFTRDVLIEVKEKQTGSLSLGAGLGSDLGFSGSIDLTQRNFDITDWPESAGEFFTGRAFRGAGQYFNVALQPGNQYSQYRVSFSEPSLLESGYFLDTNAYYTNWDQSLWHEKRMGGNVGLGHRFGDVWSASVRARGESVDITTIDPSAATDVFAVQGNSMLTALALGISRTTTDSRLFPTTGSTLDVSLSRAGLLGGDYDFTKAEASYHKYWTVDEDFFGYKTVVSFRGQAGYIFDTAPFFERFYTGGRGFRGFKFHGIGPRGIRNDNGQPSEDSIGGNWNFFAGLEYNFPIYQDVLRGVVFTDTGTVQDNIGFDQYRASLGAGVRIKIPFLGQAPFALDFAIPFAKKTGDQTQFISFSIDVPFR